jgi:hypothetical protein
LTIRLDRGDYLMSPLLVSEPAASSPAPPSSPTAARLRAEQLLSEWSVHAAEQPADAERDDHSRIRLRLDGISPRPLEGAGNLLRGRGRGIGDLGGAVARLAVEVRGGILHFAGHIAGLLLGVAEGAVEVWIRGTVLWHGSAPLETGGRPTTRNMAESSTREERLSRPRVVDSENQIFL